MLGALVLCSLPIGLFVFLPDIVPIHRVGQAQVFGFMALAVVVALLTFFALSIKAFFAFTTLIIPVIPYFSSYLPPLGGQILMALPEAGLTLFFAMIFMQIIWKNKVKMSAVNVFILLWVLFNTISLVLSQDLMESLPRYVLGVVFASLYLAILHNIILREKDGLKFAITIFLLANFGFVLFGIVLTGIASGWSSVADLYHSRMGETVSTGHFGSNAFAGYMLMFLPLLFWSLVIKPGYCRLPKVISWPMLLISLLVIIFSVSRGNLVAMILMMALWSYFLLTHKPGINIIYVSIFLFIISFVMINEIELIEMLLTRFIDDQQLSLQNFLYRSLKNVRVLLGETAFAVFQDNWFAGVGLGNMRSEMLTRIGMNFDAHNLALNVLAEQGAAVFITLSVAFVYISSLVWRCVKTKGRDDAWLAISIYAGLVLYLVRSVTTGGQLVGDEFMGSHKVCWLFTAGALIYHIAKTPGNVTAGATSGLLPPDSVDISHVTQNTAQAKQLD